MVETVGQSGPRREPSPGGLRIAVHQPHYFPWAGLVHKIASVDELVVLDDVQFSRRNFQHRAQYPTALGPKWLSIPLRHTGRTDQRQRFDELSYAEHNHSIFRKHLQTLHHVYATAPGWRLVKDRLLEMYDRHIESEFGPLDLMVDSLILTLDLLGVQRTIHRASSLKVGGSRDSHILTIANALGAKVYVSGPGAANYMHDDMFESHGVRVEYQQFVHPTYKQLHTGEFVPGCLALDFYLCAPEAARTFFARAAEVAR